jgi:DNA-binding MarR family transcriptional regulator
MLTTLIRKIDERSFFVRTSNLTVFIVGANKYPGGMTSHTAHPAGPGGRGEADGSDERSVPLDAEEEAAWRAMARAILVVPRILEAELLEAHDLNLAEYSALMNLSESPGRSMRMTELANAVALSVSGLTRVIERLTRQGLTERVRCPTDARGHLAHLTDAGFSRLEAAYPRHLEGVRRHVMDHLVGRLDLEAFTAAVGSMAAGTAQAAPRRTR